MNLNDYLEAKESAASLSAKIGVTPVLVSQWRNGVRQIPIERCVAIERATEGAVTRQDLRPDDWHLIWPELARKSALT
jgi:DNA-binding transcriptional regulator YdaS (Cro superfamily)